MVLRRRCDQEGEFWQLRVVGAAAARCREALLEIASLPVETGRFAKTDRQDHCCTFCDGGAVGDEKHLLMECPATLQMLFCFLHLAVHVPMSHCCTCLMRVNRVVDEINPVRKHAGAIFAARLGHSPRALLARRNNLQPFCTRSV